MGNGTYTGKTLHNMTCPYCGNNKARKGVIRTYGGDIHIMKCSKCGMRI